LNPVPLTTVLHHGTTLRRALSIEANGPDPTFREPGSARLPPAEGFSTVIGDGRPCVTGNPETAARNKDVLFPGEGGPAILEVGVPDRIMAILYADPIAAGLARGGEIRFEPGCGLEELLAAWHTLTKRVIPLPQPTTP
jgi:hypothetical protein